MTTATARWFSIAALNAALVTPALAIDKPQATTPDSTDQSSLDTDPSQQTLIISEVIRQPAVNSDDSGITVYDDPFTFNALSRITLNQLRVDANASQPDVVKDPFQPLNRKVFKFNSKIDQHVLLPVAKAYKNKVPKPVQNGIGNFFSNLREPWNAVNYLLQGHGISSSKSLGRFTVNTLGSLGLADPASKLGLKSQDDEDFGQTLGKWGIKSGPFLMLPILGPSTLRDGVAGIADSFGRPLSYMSQDSTYWSLTALEVVDARAGFVGVEDLVQGDQYALLRDLYLQRRQYLISGSEQNAGLDSSFGDENASFGDDNTSFGDTKDPNANTSSSSSNMDNSFGDPKPAAEAVNPASPNHHQDTDAAF